MVLKRKPMKELKISLHEVLFHIPIGDLCDLVQTNESQGSEFLLVSSVVND